jgi:arsenate reductase
LFKILTDKGIDFEKVEYLINPISKTKLKELVRKSGGSVRDFVRTKESEYKELNVAQMNDDELYDVLAKVPVLVQRPIVEIDDSAIVARPAEKVLEIL